MNKSWDLIVIGGGPAGLMSATIAARRGREVLLLEKNPSTGRKLRITGGGRCNLTNHTLDTHSLLTKYGAAKDFLFSAFAQHAVADSLVFFHQAGLATMTEAENRVFPQSERAEDVALALEKMAAKAGVKIMTNITVQKILTDDKGIITGLRTNQGIFSASAYVLATGGTSRPDTGSTGDGYTWLSDIGHTVTRPSPSLVPITVYETWVRELAGLSLIDTDITLRQNEQVFLKAKGKVLFTHEGLSGPGILNNSKAIADTLPHGPVTITINTCPELSEEDITNLLRDLPKTAPNRMIKNCLADIIPARLVTPVLKGAQIEAERIINTITRAERHHLTSVIRALPLRISGLLGANKAIIASGGVALSEIDFKTMKSKLHNNLYIVGDLLDINRPSGGYSLQLCWTTGYVAGSSI